jgi:putative transposase
MEDYRRGSHTVWDCKYRLVWTRKYRYRVLGGEVGERCRELLREIARSKEMRIYAGSINRDPVHILIGIAPYLSVLRAVNELLPKVVYDWLNQAAA